ncbi:hypothetical protein J6590_076959 [Homalodisca vitripennis]|nr:hypothetical protein J6590_076959 [Homalodisca vitripennis]
METKREHNVSVLGGVRACSAGRTDATRCRKGFTSLPVNILNEDVPTQETT